MTSDTVVYDASMAVVLWRSIICSSLGETVFPYCLWVKALSLGNLHELLEVIAKKSMRKYTALLFSPPLESFRVENKARITRNSKGQSMDIQKVVVHVADSITRFIKASAIEENRAVTLATLEGLNLPTAKLTSWVSTLSQLTSLRVRDGSVLNSDVGRAIRESCPSFKEV